MPLVFRRDNEDAARTLVGECYFRDLMDGEVLDAAGHGNESAYEHMAAQKMSSALKERFPDIEKENGFGEAMDSLSDMFLDHPPKVGPRFNGSVSDSSARSALDCREQARSGHVAQFCHRCIKPAECAN
jgi:hypothetical protein